MRTVSVAIAVLALWTALAASQDAPADKASQVPASDIRALRARWVSPDAELSDRKKIRRYESILRTGRQLERGYPEAENLYVAQALMLQASRGLLILNAGNVDRENVIRLATEIVDSSAPPGWRFEADLLLTQLDVATRDAEEQDVGERIEGFIARYQGTSVVAAALMRGADMARAYEQDKLYSALIEQLRQEYLDHEGVGAFLVRHGQKIPREGRSFLAQVPRLGAGELMLPRDALGRMTIALFWDPRSGLGARHMGATADYLKDNPQLHLRAVGISTFDDSEAIGRVVEEQAVKFPVGYLPEGADSPVMESLGVNEVPMYFLLGPDGRIIDTPRYFHGMRWRSTRGSLQKHLPRLWRSEARLLLVRSGLGLIDPLDAEAPASLNRAIDRLREALLSDQPGPVQIEAILAAGKGFDCLQGLSSPAKQAAKMLGIACERWAAMAGGDNEVSADWVETANEIAAEDNTPATHLLADYYLRLKKVHEASPAQAEAAIRSFAESRQDLASVDVDTRMLAMALALERGLDAPRRKLQAELSSLDTLAIPRVRGLMRDWALAKPEVELKLRFDLALTDLDGNQIRIGRGIDGDAIIVHFWSAAAPIGSAGVWAWQEEPPSAYAIKKPREGVTIVAVNVDGDLDAARKLADRHPEWVHAWCPAGWRDPTLRALDVTAMPSSWVFGKDGGVLADDTVVSVRKALEDRMKMSTWVLFWRDVTLRQWYLRGMRLWLGFQARPAGKALLGEDLFPAKRKAEYRKGYDWLTGNGLHNAIRTSAEPIHRQILDTIGKMPEADKPSAATRARLAGLYRRLADLEGYLDRMNKLTEDDDWPDWAPQASAINKQRSQLYTIDARRHRPDETLRERLTDLYGPREAGRWWSLKPAPQWLKLEDPAN